MCQGGLTAFRVSLPCRQAKKFAALDLQSHLRFWRGSDLELPPWPFTFRVLKIPRILFNVFFALGEKNACSPAASAAARSPFGSSKKLATHAVSASGAISMGQANYAVKGAQLRFPSCFLSWFSPPTKHCRFQTRSGHRASAPAPFRLR